MTRLLFQETQVSRDFEATLNIVLSISCHTEDHLKKEPDDLTLHCSDHARIDSNSNSENHLKTSKLELNNTTNEWKSFDLNLDEDVNNEVAAEEQLNPSISKEDDQVSSEDQIKNDQPSGSQSKIHNSGFISKLINFPSFFHHLTIPKTTDLIEKSFILTITVENLGTVDLTVWNNFTIGKIIYLVSEVKSLSEKAVSLYLQTTRLESDKTLIHYNVHPKSNIHLKMLLKIEYIGKFEQMIIPIFIYTSETVFEVKRLFSNVIKVIPESLELRLNGVMLDNANQIFVYTTDAKIIIDISTKNLTSMDDSSDKLNTSLGHEMSQSFQRMASNLKACKCNEIRLKAISKGILSKIDDRYNNPKFFSVLKDFTTNLHLISCYKAEFGSSLSANSSEMSSDLISSEEVSIDDCIHAELRRIENIKMIFIEETDLEYLSKVKSFRDFKSFLRKRIGTECNLRSVAMLYNYARKLVKYINHNEKHNTEVIRMIKYIKRYFLKYFEKDIITKGGLTALALSGSDIEE